MAQSSWPRPRIRADGKQRTVALGVPARGGEDWSLQDGQGFQMNRAHPFQEGMLGDLDFERFHHVVVFIRLIG